MPAAAAEAPTGSHQVFAMMKYEPTRVISQMTTRRPRPIKRAPPPVLSRLSPEQAKNPRHSPWGIQNGANISQVFLEARKFLHAMHAIEGFVTRDSWRGTHS